MPCVAQGYWQYSQECIRQAVEADTPELRDQMLELARTWNQAALHVVTPQLKRSHLLDKTWPHRQDPREEVRRG